MKLAEPRTVWRLVPEIRAKTAFDGEGARLHGGRWNHPGLPAVYLSATLSLAALEVLVHVDPEDAPDAWAAIPVELPAGLEIERFGAGDLPPDWRDYPAPESLVDLGTRWLRSATTVLLQVPSAVVPRESNYVLNPRHPDLDRLAFASLEPFSFDPRLWPTG